MDATVKVFYVQTHQSFMRPWEESEYASESTGFIIPGRRVLTSSHSAENIQQVKLKKQGSAEKYVATVLATGSDCGIALLTVDNDEFWRGVSPVEFGSLPAVEDSVTVVGYPMGGDEISITRGVVSCIDMFSYVHGSIQLLGLQINPGINSGCSGGPAFNDKGQCVGISFQSSKDGDSENIGYLISTPVVMHFFRDYEKSEKYTGFPVLGIGWQNMKNRYQREAMGITSGQTGVMVNRVDPIASAYQYLKVYDILIRFDGVDIANDGTVPFRHGGRISFTDLVSQRYTGDTVAIEVLRDSKVHKFNIEVKTNTELIPCRMQRKPISYYIFGGLVFTAVSPDDQIVVVSQVLVAEINSVYAPDISNLRVLKLNGIPIKNLRSLVNMIDECKEKYLKFNLDNLLVYLETKTAKAATLDILATYCISSALSDDLKS